MQSFSSFLIEAKFSEENFERLLSAIEKRAQKTLGKLYRYGGPTGTEKFSGGTVGYLYFFGNKAFRVRARTGHILGIDVWTAYQADKGPDFIIHLNDLDSSTVIGALGEIVKIIKSPAETKISIKEEAILEMAKRTGDADFYSMMKSEYGERGAADVTWEQIKAVASKNDVLIPAYIRNQKIGRGRWNSQPGSASSDAQPADAAKAVTAKKEPILYIKVTAQDPDTKKFISTGNNAAAQKLYGQLQTAMDSGPTEAEVKDPDTLYGHMAQLVGMAVKGTLRSLLIYGGPGTGKTYTIMKTIDEGGLVKNQDFVKLSGKASPIEIYKTLFMFRERGLVVFDDLDSMWRNEDATNILKAALDTSPVREISWASTQTINVSKMSDDAREKLFKGIDAALNGDVVEMPALTDEEREEMTPAQIKKYEREREKSGDTVSPDKVKYPSTFDFKGRVIFISNLKKEEFDSAILSRSAKINMDITPEQILARMRKILPSLGGDDVKLSLKEELLDHLLVMHKRKEITAVTMREFTKSLDIVRSGVPNWRELCVYA